MTKPPFVFILGMHRSGTSCLAGALKACGLHLGDVTWRNRHNPKGHFEARALAALHDRILAAANAHWSMPPEGDIDVHPAIRVALHDHARTLAENRPCGVKDPRMLLLLSTWRKLAPGPIRLVGTFRHPLAVAASLKARNGMSIEDGFELWQRYNLRLLAAHREDPFPLVAYDLSDPVAYRRTVLAMAQDLGLRPSPWRVRRFVTRALDHQSASVTGQTLPPEILTTYAALNHAAQTGVGPMNKNEQ